MNAMTTFLETQRDTLSRHLRHHLQGEVRFDPPSRKLYSTDASIYQIEPLGVVIPRSVDDIVATVQAVGEMGLSITARGGGTSLSGQAIGPGVILDCSKYLNNILHIDPTNRTVRVQPGVILDSLNRALAGHGLQFGPDVSTTSRANLGGMIGNNSAGSRSIVYGKTIDHVRALDVILADGSRSTFGYISPREWAQKGQGTSLEAQAYRQVRDVVAGNREEILKRFPRILRRVSGYNLDALLPLLGQSLTSGAPIPPQGYVAPAGSVGLHQLLVGSEGTLAIIAEAELNVVRAPRHRGLLVPQFRSLADAMNALAPCLEANPTAVEMMDKLLLDLTKGNLALRHVTQLFRPDVGAVFMVEFSSDNLAEVQDQVEKLAARLKGVDGLLCTTPAVDPAVRDPLWNLRRDAMPLLYGMVGDAKPITFVEDTAVSPERLPEFVTRFREILHSHGTDGAFYGHASVGCLHIRPVLNLKAPDDVVRMRKIADEVVELVAAHGGSLSGEHGDGLARSEFNQRMFGSVLYDAFRQVKRAFDPQGILNPGKIVEAPPMTENLRYPPGYAPQEPRVVFDYRKQEGFVRSVEMCNGSGACRKLQGGAMCPSFRATQDERDSTRGRANALRLALVGEGTPSGPTQKWVHDVFDLCLMCKACKSECPSNVDVAKLKAEFLQLYYRKHTRPLGDYLMAGLPWFNRFASPLAPLVNGISRLGVTRWLLEQTAHIDHRRTLPALHALDFRRWFRWHRRDPRAGTVGKVMLLADCFTTYNDPSVGRAAVRVLERAGYSVELADLFCCGRVAISKGFLSYAKKLVTRQAPALARRLSEGVPILGLEPSCLLTLADEWTDLLPGSTTARIAASAHLADSWLASQVRDGRCELPLRPKTGKCVLHGHCHQKALLGVAASAPALRMVPGLDVQVLDAGCCGMAGSFGFEKEHYPLSVKIAGLALLPALEKEPEALVCAPGTSCRHQIADLAKRKALHPMEVLAESL
jgi:FAD/FMN-containing dehydrogenase/Fe-S oxidoreductase